MELKKYRDSREQLFRESFERLPDYEQYLLRSNPRHVERWRMNESQIELTDAQTTLLSTFKRKMPVIVLSGIWCGDCARECPMFRAIERAAPVIQFRYADNSENTTLRDELRMNGAERVPLVVALNEDFHEVQRFGDKPLSVYRRKAKNEFGAACDPGLLPAPGNELQAELQEWIDIFERAQLIVRLAPQYRQKYGD